MSYLCGHEARLDCAASEAVAKTEGVARRWVMGLTLSVASFLIISTNLLVAAALLRLLIRKSSQSWCFVLNLALADVMVGVAITGLATEDFNSGGAHANATQLQQGQEALNATQGKHRCLMRMAFVTSPCTASIMSMFLISLDRYAAIKMPLRYTQLSGKGTAMVSLLALWSAAIIMGFLPVMVRQLQTDGYDGFCAFFSVIHQVGMVVLFSVCFFLVLSVFVYIYLDILKIACSHQKQILQVRQAGSRTSDPRDQQQQRQQSEGRPHHQQHQQPHHHQPLRTWSHVKALRTVAVLVGCFLLLWCPFFVVCIVHLLCKSCKLTDVLENYLWLLGLSNSLINPLVYAFWQREVRLQLAAMFCCCRRRSGAAGAVERSYLPNVLTQPGAPAGDGPNPSLLRPIISNNKATTSL